MATSPGAGSTSRSASSIAATKSTARLHWCSRPRSEQADLPHKPIYPLAAADSSGFGGNVDQWDDMSCMYSRDAAPRLWKRVGLGPKDMDIALMFDCFTYTVMATFEDFGFCEKGEVGDYFREGRATYGGDVVVNPYGGLLSEG